MEIATAVIDYQGRVLASTGTGSQLGRATDKAYTALMYGVATHELRPSSKPLWRSESEIEHTRVLVEPGGFPVIDGVDTLGAIGVAGEATPDHLILCGQAGLLSRLNAL